VISGNPRLVYLTFNAQRARVKSLIQEVIKGAREGGKSWGDQAGLQGEMERSQTASSFKTAPKGTDFSESFGNGIEA